MLRGKRYGGCGGAPLGPPIKALPRWVPPVRHTGKRIMFKGYFLMSLDTIQATIGIFIVYEE